MATITVIGTGAIGTAITHRLLTTGHHVTVWNRTPARTTDLTTAGAQLAHTPAEAVTASALTLLTVTDYTAAHHILDALPPHLTGHTIAALCTGTPTDARTTADKTTHLGAHYLDAGIQDPPHAFTTGTATVLYSGNRTTYDHHHTVLATLGPPRYAGHHPHAAAVWNLALFGLWYDTQLGLLRALHTARTAGLDLDDFATTAGLQIGHVTAAITSTVDELHRADYPPGPATLPEHLTVLRQLTELHAGNPLGDGGLPTITAHLETLITAGRHAQGLTAAIHPPAAHPPAPPRTHH